MKRKNTVGIFYNVFLLIAMYFALFVLLQLGSQFWAVLIGGIVILMSGYLFFTYKEQEKQEQKEQEHIILERKLDELLNAQRAIYTITKRGMEKGVKSFPESHGNDELKVLLEKIIEFQNQQCIESRKHAETQVNALKTVAWYNKENTKQILLNLDKNINALLNILQDSSSEFAQRSQNSVTQDSAKTGVSDLKEEADVVMTIKGGEEPGDNTAIDLLLMETKEPTAEATNETEMAEMPEIPGMSEELKDGDMSSGKSKTVFELEKDGKMPNVEMTMAAGMGEPELLSNEEPIPSMISEYEGLTEKGEGLDSDDLASLIASLTK
ncbi:MAG: hypothetical protein K2N63_08020 [Lachnospiraceae bacterium]|nr:hypothetical protein [Lachnospiraceae bacterium]